MYMLCENVIWHIFNDVNMVWCEEGGSAGCEICRDTRHPPPAQLIVKFNCRFHPVEGIFFTQYVEFKYFALKCQDLDLNQSTTPINTHQQCLSAKKRGVHFVFCFVADHHSPSSPQGLMTHSLSFNSGLKVASPLDGGLTVDTFASSATP